MDWNKTKTIFIIVFAILNVFLYSLYVNRHTETEKLELLTETPIEERLKADNIQLKNIPAPVEESSYVSGKMKVFTAEDINQLVGQTLTITDGTKLSSTLVSPYKLLSVENIESFSEFLTTYVTDGETYALWEIDKENRTATFFQKVNDRMIYFSPSDATLKVYWNEDEEVVGYEQKMFADLEDFNQMKDLLSPIQVVNTLYQRGQLKQDYKVNSMELGYSTLVQLTETQVFAPTWHVLVEANDGKEHHLFVNAVEGKIIEFQTEAEVIEEQ